MQGKAVLVILSSLIVVVLSGCPQQATLLPCECYDNHITCGGRDRYSVKEVFDKVNANIKAETERHLITFTLSNGAIEELEDDAFGTVTFMDIQFNRAENFKRIHANALKASLGSMESVLTVGPTMLGKGSETELFQILSSFNNLRDLQLEYHGIQSIPEHAFHNDKQTKLNYIDFNYFEPIHPKSTRQIKSIGKHAFWGLNYLTKLGLFGQAIDSISSGAFEFEYTSNETLKINLGDNPLNGTIEAGAFENIKRPTNLNLFDANFEFVDEKVFAPFLKADKRNHLSLGNSNTLNNFKCDCRSHWLIRDRYTLYSGQIDIGFKCDTKSQMYSDACV